MEQLYCVQILFLWYTRLMKKEVIIGIGVIALILVGFFLLRSDNENPDLETVELKIAQCSQEEYATMVTNAPKDGCATEWAVICSEGSTWKYQCFGGQVVEVPEADLQAQLEAAQKEFYELCEKNPDLLCG